MQSNNLLDLSSFSKGIKFFSIMLDNVFNASEKEKRNISTIFEKGLKLGAIKPISRKIFQKDEVETAVRYMAAGKHVGKIIIKIQEENKFLNTSVPALLRYYCLANKSYIILGGLGGFGLELADWLVIRGARNLVLISRSGIKNGYQQRKMDLWKSYGVNVLIMSNVDATKSIGCEHLLKSAEQLAPVDAIFNLAVVLNDKLCQNHTVETFQETFKAKAWATKHLDEMSRKICLQLRHFVVFSSVSCGRGNPGQTNYGMANSIMERICERRYQEGLHGLAIQWGAIGDVGLVADMMDDDKEMVIGGTLQQKITSCIEKLEEFLLQKYPVVASMVVAEKNTHLDELNVVDRVANIIGVKDINLVSHHMLLSELGMDSMMLMEIKQTLEREFDTFLSTQDIRRLTFAKLIEMFDNDTQNKTEFSQTVDTTSDINATALLFRISKNQLTPGICLDLPTKQVNTKTKVFLLPGLDGCGSTFDPLIQKIEASATCLQHGTYNLRTEFSSINDIADCLLQYVLDRIKVGQTFVMVGYSFGSLIAIELARRLEARNVQGRLVLIDGAPEQMKAMTNSRFTTNEGQNNILLAITEYIQPTSKAKLLLELNKCGNWDEKIETFISQLSSVELLKQLSSDMIRAQCTTIYKHLLAVEEYDVANLPKIASPIILLKPTMESVSSLEQDYGLHKITDGNVAVHYVDGNHVTMLEEDNVVAAINGKEI